MGKTGCVSAMTCLISYLMSCQNLSISEHSETLQICQMFQCLPEGTSEVLVQIMAYSVRNVFSLLDSIGRCATSSLAIAPLPADFCNSCIEVPACAMRGVCSRNAVLESVSIERASANENYRVCRKHLLTCCITCCLIWWHCKLSQWQ